MRRRQQGISEWLDVRRVRVSVFRCRGDGEMRRSERMGRPVVSDEEVGGGLWAVEEILYLH